MLVEYGHLGLPGCSPLLEPAPACPAMPSLPTSLPTSGVVGPSTLSVGLQASSLGLLDCVRGANSLQAKTLQTQQKLIKKLLESCAAVTTATSVSSTTTSTESLTSKTQNNILLRKAQERRKKKRHRKRKALR